MITSRSTDFTVYDDRWVLAGEMDRSSLWVDLAWAGKDPDRPFTLPDGREYPEVVAAGQFHQIADQVWLEVTNPGRAGDMLWSTGMALTVVSRRLADALVELGAADVGIFPVTIPQQPADQDGYVIVICHGSDADRPIREFPLGRRSTPWLDVSTAVLTGLRQRGVGGFGVEAARQWAEGIAAEAGDPPEDIDPGGSSRWSSERGSDAVAWVLTIDETITQSQWAIPDAMAPSPGNLTENGDGSLAVLASDGTVLGTISPPAATDVSGKMINAFWVQDEGRTLLIVDHIPGLNDYPVTVHVTVS